MSKSPAITKASLASTKLAPVHPCRFFGTSAQYWLNLQNQYDRACIDHDAIERDVIPHPAPHARGA